MLILTMNISILLQNREDVLKTFRSLLGPTLVEPGCKKCIFYEELGQNNRLGLIQEWETYADFERYVRLDYFKKILALMEISNSRPELKIITIKNAAGLETIEAIRIKEPDRKKQAEK